MHPHTVYNINVLYNIKKNPKLSLRYLTHETVNSCKNSRTKITLMSFILIWKQNNQSLIVYFGSTVLKDKKNTSLEELHH